MLRRTFRTPQQPVDRADHHADQVDVAPLVEPSDIIGVADLSAMENRIDGTCVVDHVKPVADVFTPAVYG